MKYHRRRFKKPCLMHGERPPPIHTAFLNCSPRHRWGLGTKRLTAIPMTLCNLEVSANGKKRSRMTHGKRERELMLRPTQTTSPQTHAI